MPREPKPYNPGLLVKGQGVLLLFIAAVGVGAHGALGYWAWDKPIATVDSVEPTQARRREDHDVDLAAVDLADPRGHVTADRNDLDGRVETLHQRAAA